MAKKHYGPMYSKPLLIYFFSENLSFLNLKKFNSSRANEQRTGFMLYCKKNVKGYAFWNDAFKGTIRKDQIGFRTGTIWKVLVLVINRYTLCFNRNWNIYWANNLLGKTAGLENWNPSSCWLEKLKEAWHEIFSFCIFNKLVSPMGMVLNTLLY